LFFFSRVTGGNKDAASTLSSTTILSQPWDPVELARQERIKINDNNKNPRLVF
jgi:hypothetical protein